MEACDICVDFSNAQSFGMVYIEAIMNGRMVLCRHNEGSDEVLKEIPEAFYRSNEELLEKIRGARRIPADTLRRNCEIISRDYSREAVTEKFLSLVNR